MNELTPEQIRAGRGLLGWSQRELAEKSVVHLKTVARLEIDGDEKHAVSRIKVQRQLEAGGVVFIPEDERLGPGVRLAKGVVSERVATAQSKSSKPSLNK
ncbi:helix-turn-helix domain-containing protein [Neorhizobium galegae]|uniref:helix-turn-helix domain-containing protein n=1 Tax=Neorhizobium galegae TaxID=399 RepID=UPI00177F0AE0|nr:helix-turn-helix transcriptional regulator [Neorhizobium galegae]